MKSSFNFSGRLGWVVIATCVFMLCGARVFAGDLNLEAQLIWATDQPKSPNPRHKPAPDWVVNKLKSTHFTWNYYFEVNRTNFPVAQDDSTHVVLSRHCEITVHNLGNDVVEVSLAGKGKPVGKIKQSVPKGQLLVIGGDAENLTAWFVVLRQVE